MTSDVKFSSLPNGNPPQDSDSIPIARGGSNYQITPAGLKTYIGGGGGGGGVSSITAGTGISTNASTGSVTVTNSGVTGLTAGSNITLSGSTGNVTISATGGGGGGGVSSITAGSGISVSSPTGSVTITNSGVTSLTAGSGVTLSGSSGNVTVTSTSGLIPRVVSYPTSPITPNVDTTDIVNAGTITSSTQFLPPSGTRHDGQKLIVKFKSSALSIPLFWSSLFGGYRGIGITLPASTTNTGMVYVGFMYNSADNYWDAVALAVQ
jgi:hypothetical protein